MSTGLARSVALAMARQRQLAAQRKAAATVLARYGASPAVATWAEFVTRLDEPRPYHMLFRITERGVSA